MTFLKSISISGIKLLILSFFLFLSYNEYCNSKILFTISPANSSQRIDSQEQIVDSWDGRKIKLIGRGEDSSVPMPIYLRRDINSCIEA